ncbi:MAG: DUF1549 and DUF1553 domain-containing protein [Planctomycetota bacterium]|nr:DUF1549 and DUF1553 domain-containing protein [Planctomycetota bacterium]
MSYWTTVRTILPFVFGCPLLTAAETAEQPAAGASASSAAPGAQPVIALALGAPGSAPGELAPGGLLRGADARFQLVVTGREVTGTLRDLTHLVRYESEPEGVVEIAADGLVTPVGNGRVKVVARLEGVENVAAETLLEVTDFGRELPVNFPNQVVPIFTKLGCNGGGCHGKSGGQNGFALSLLGFYPREDYEFLVKESQGRRVMVAAPDRSLLLLKSTNMLPHGGGARIEPGSHEHRILHRWMRQGMPYGAKDDPVVEGITVFPEVRRMSREDRQQLRVLARYTDGFVEDVTRVATYEPNDKEFAEVEESGLVKTLDLSGGASVMVRYQAQVAVFRAIIPLGVEVTDLPQPRNFIDELVFRKWKELGIPPSKPADDLTFLRRVTLAVTGRLPTYEEAVAFESEEDAARRDRLIDRLLKSTDYATFFANKWSAILRNKRVNGNYTRGTYGFYNWLRNSFYREKPYDRFVRDILAASGEIGQNPPVAWYRAVRSTEQQVEDSAQLFMGLRIQCARCHHHPFERWSQKDYYGYSAFFSRIGRKKNNDGRPDEERIYHNPGTAAATNPRSRETLRPTGLGGEPLEISADRDPRQALVDWLAEPSNPFFARALVNRYWKHFFGRGLVEPEDDMRVTNPPSHPDLLDALAKNFVDSGYDLKSLIRTICRSVTYQLSAIPNDHNAKDKQSFSRYYPKRLNAEVLYDALHTVTGARTSFSGLPPGTRAVEIPDSGVNNYFLTVFGRPMAESSCECERSGDASLAQSLHLLNSKEVLGKISAGDGRAAKLAAEKERSDEDKLRELYFRVYSRPPVAEEVKIALAHLQKDSGKKKAAWEDIIWALLNTKEFLFNH